MSLLRDLKDYQQRTLNVLEEFLSQIKTKRSISDAFSFITNKYYKEPVAYINNEEYISANVPHICLRVPTGGGKTLIAANAINVISKKIYHKENNMIIWFVPSTAILNQTVEALKDKQSIYREHLEIHYQDIEVLTVQEALNVSKSTLDNNLTIIVSTFQSFRIEEAEGRKVYNSSGDLMEHFTSKVMNLGSNLLKSDDGVIQYSLANIINSRNPLIIVDEAHNAKTDLSFEFLGKLNPKFILELTATPESKKYPLNVLYSVSAAELKSEKMLKIPMYVHTKYDWKELLNNAISKRVELEELSSKESRYVRPIMLIQAQPDRKDNPLVLNVKKVLETLTNDFKIDRKYIAVHTGEIKELDNYDLMAKDCDIRYIITVSALKEGWDCPYAYVLCSLAELSSSVSVEQIVGRIIRQPYTLDFEEKRLNNSYAYIFSQNFIYTLNSLRDAFVKNGFSQFELDKLLRKGTSKLANTQLTFDSFEEDEVSELVEDIEIANGSVRVKIKSEVQATEFEEFKNILKNFDKEETLLFKMNSENLVLNENEVNEIEQNIQEDKHNEEEALSFREDLGNLELVNLDVIGNEIKEIEQNIQEGHLENYVYAPSQYNSKIGIHENQIIIREPLNDEESKEILDQIESETFKKVFSDVIKAVNNLSPAERGLEFVVPLLTYKSKVNQLLEMEEPYTIFDVDYLDNSWDLKEYSDKINDFTFDLEDKNKLAGMIDIDEEGSTTTEAVEIDHLFEELFIESADTWSKEELVSWLDNNMRNKDISRSDSIIFLSQAVNYLIDEEEYSISELVRDKFRLRENVKMLISNCREIAKTRGFQLFLEAEEFRVDEKIAFTYKNDDYPYNQLYKPGYKFRKHFYKEIGDLVPKGEEYECAMYIDQLDEVEYWVRNIPIRRYSSFWLQTSTDRFYPDFVCKLKDGRVLVVEYKGEDRWSDDDSTEKRLLGNIWANNSDGKAIFVMPRGKDLKAIDLALNLK